MLNPANEQKYSETPAARIKQLASRLDVSIYLDYTDDTQEAKMESCYSYNKKTKELTIVASLLEKIDKPLLLDIIRSSFNFEKTIIKDSTVQLLKSYQEYASQPKDKQILSFFENLIPEGDFSALKMALYLRYQATQKRGNISHLKADIRYRFGDRGVNIANLCSTGYFEEFMEAYNNAGSKELFFGIL